MVKSRLKKSNIEISKIHLSIYKIMKSNSNGNIFISYDCVREIMNRLLAKFPKTIHYSTLKEMESFGLIKKYGNKRSLIYELVGGNIDNSINNLPIPL